MKHLVLRLFLFSSFFYLNSTNIAITIDDHPLPSGFIFSCHERTKALIEACNYHNVKAAFFCIGKNCKENDQDLLTSLNYQGHFLGNHSFLHYHSSKLSPQEFEIEIKETEKILKIYAQMRKWFRYPFLDYGNQKHLGGAQEKAITLYNILKQQGYSEGYVTINTFDWHIDFRLQKALSEGKRVNYDALKMMYVSLVKEWCSYYIDLYKDIKITHTLLLHANDLNALFLKDILTTIKGAGWTIVSPECAFKDVSWREAVIYNNQITQLFDKLISKPRSLDCNQIDQLINELHIFDDK